MQHCYSSSQSNSALKDDHRYYVGAFHQFYCDGYESHRYEYSNNLGVALKDRAYREGKDTFLDSLGCNVGEESSSYQEGRVQESRSWGAWVELKGVSYSASFYYCWTSNCLNR